MRFTSHNKYMACNNCFEEEMFGRTKTEKEKEDDNNAYMAMETNKWYSELFNKILQRKELLPLLLGIDEDFDYSIIKALKEE